MLDKSIPFHTIIMRSANDRLCTVPGLPEGFSIRCWQPGDEAAWAAIQTAVGEFENTDDAMRCFRHYLEDEEGLRRRQIYVTDDARAMPVATATAWHSRKKGRPIGVVHALSCLPAYQSRGLGRIAAASMMNVFYRLMPGCDVWLDTQTWSYKAIGIYLDLGFVPMKTATYNGVPNEYPEAVRVLKDRMRPDVFRRFADRAE